MAIEYVPWSEKTEEEKAAFQDKLTYWRENGAPGVQRDEAEAFVSHADGKTYTSNSEYRKSLKANGYIEVGNEKLPEKKKTEITDEQISDAIDKSAAQLGYSI